MLEVLVSAGLIVGIMIVGAFVVSLIIKRNDIADVLWGAYPAAVAGYFWLVSGGSSVGVIVQLFVIIWGVRLVLHIGSRNLRKSEDPRYGVWRTQWGKWFVLRSFAQVYLLQGVLSLLVMMPLILFAGRGDGHMYIPVLFIVGSIVWCVGFYFEAVGDYQLRTFLADHANKGKIMTEGLWCYTRHPNYFGEVTMWWGIFLVVVSVFGFSLVTAYAMISPVVITILILGVSGIPMVERRYQGDKAFDAYKKQTNAFFPGPVKGAL